MNTVDIVLGIVLLLGVVQGFLKGFLVELAGLLALILGIYAAIHFSDYTFVFLQDFISRDDEQLYWVSFAATFILVVVFISILGRVLTKIVHLIALGILNRIFGAVFGFLKMAFLASLFLMLLSYTNIFNIGEKTLSESILYSPIRQLAPAVLPKVIEEVKEKEILYPETGDEKGNV